MNEHIWRGAFQLRQRYGPSPDGAFVKLLGCFSFRHIAHPLFDLKILLYFSKSKMAKMAFGSSSQNGGSEQLYFAFGSNMHLGQMHRRCPVSRYIGTAILPNYRFHINSRGYANVLFSAGDCVEGLVYLITEDDQMKLDMYEGVSTGCYEKQLLLIEVCPASINHLGRLAFDVAQQLEHQRPDYTLAESSTISGNNLDQKSPINRQQPSQQDLGAQGAFSADGPHAFNDIIDTKSTQVDDFSSTSIQHRPRERKTNALVYISLQFQEDGQICDEYIERMNAAIVDARKLGISEWYIRNCLRRFIPERQLPE